MNRVTNFLKGVSFKRKLLSYFLLLSIVPVLLVGLLSSSMTSANVQKKVNEHHQFVLGQTQTQLNNFIKNLNISSIQIATDPAIEKSVREGPYTENLKTTFDMTEAIRRHRSISPIRFNVSLLYNRFNHTYSNAYSSEMLANYRFDHLVQKHAAQSNQPFIVPPNPLDEKEELLIFRPIPMSTRYTEGTLVLHVSVDELTKYAGMRSLGNNSRLMVINDEGRIVFSNHTNEIGAKLSLFPELHHFWSNRTHSDQPVAINETKYKLSSLESSYNRWTYIVMTPMDELTRESKNIQLITWTVVASLSILWVVMAYIGSNRIYYPIRRLLNKMGFTGKEKTRMGNELAIVNSYVHQLSHHNRQMKNQLQDQKPYVQQKLLEQILWGEMSVGEIRRLATDFNLQFQGPVFYVCVVEVDDYEKLTTFYKGKHRSLIQYALRKMIEEIGHTFASCVTLTMPNGRTVLIANLQEDTEENEQRMQGAVDEMRSNIKHYLNFTVTVAIGSPQKEYIDLETSYRDALALLKYKWLLGHDVTITNRMVDAEMKLSSQAVVQQQKDIVFHVVHGNIPEANRKLAKMIQEIKAYTVKPKMVLGLFSYLIGELAFLLHEIGCRLGDLCDTDLYNHLYSLDSLDEVEKWLSTEIFPTIKAHLEQQNISKQAKTIQQVLLFIQEHFDEDLSLQYVADQFDLSPSYLSRIFKEETQQNFGHYLRELRIKKAQEWLEHTGMPIKDIAKKLGYASVQNFSRIFKQISGIPPGEYRKNKMYGQR